MVVICLFINIYVIFDWVPNFPGLKRHECPLFVFLNFYLCFFLNYIQHANKEDISRTNLKFTGS
jgi:hypothetical protein